jgi:hypothetical protein
MAHGLLQLLGMRVQLLQTNGASEIAEEMSQTIYMLMVYRKNDQEDFTPKQAAILQRLVMEEFK